jgi:hypothetical protein
MPDTAAHTIHTVLLEVAASTEEAWAQLDAALSSHTIEQACRAALRPWDGAAALHRIPRLEIDLGHVEAGNIMEVQNRLSKALHTALCKEVGAPAHTAPGGKKRLSNPTKGREENWQEIMLHYLLTGTLPWYAQDSPNLVAEWQQHIANAPLKYLQWLQRQNLMRRDAILRAVALAVPVTDAAFVSLFADAAVAQWVQRLAVAAAPQQPLFTWLQVQAAHPLGQLIWAHLLQQQNRSHWVQSLANIMRKMQQQGIPVIYLKQIYTFTQRWLLEAVPDVPARKVLQATLAQAEPGLFGLSLVPAPSMDTTTPMATAWQQWEAAIQDEAATEEADEYQLEATEAPDTNWVSNAGLVLLNPAGMLAVWREQGWVKEKAIAGKEGLRNICQWMHCLVWGAAKPMLDYDLLLARIWCQVPVHVHIPLLPAPAEAIHQLANDYLRRVIVAWPQLKNTSPDGLRSGFLQRRGVLQPSPAGWQLLVEGKAQDILLRYLPWSYSIIKLPWMDKAFFTQWNTGT